MKPGTDREIAIYSEAIDALVLIRQRRASGKAIDREPLAAAGAKLSLAAIWIEAWKEGVNLS